MSEQITVVTTNDSVADYFKLTEKAEGYNREAWKDSDDVLMYGIPTDEGYELMEMYEAMCFIANNGPPEDQCTPQ